MVKALFRVLSLRYFRAYPDGQQIYSTICPALELNRCDISSKPQIAQLSAFGQLLGFGYHFS